MNFGLGIEAAQKQAEPLQDGLLVRSELLLDSAMPAKYCKIYKERARKKSRPKSLEHCPGFPSEATVVPVMTAVARQSSFVYQAQ